MIHRLEIPLEPSRARELLEAVLGAYLERYARYRPWVTWLDPSRARFGFEVHGLEITGALALEPGAARIEAHLPWALRPFGARALHVVEEHARLVLRDRPR